MPPFLETGILKGLSKRFLPENSTPRSGRAGTRSPAPSHASRRALDWFVFFLADVQTGFGAFVSVYLTEQKWTQTDVGFVLTVGSLVGLFGQIPGGAVVDATRSPRWAAACAIVAVGISAFALASSPIFAVVLVSRLLQAGASCVLGPAIAAISLGLVGQKALGERLGRNAAFASVGSGLAAAAMGICGYYFSNRTAFFVIASMAAPALFALVHVKIEEIDSARAHGGEAGPGQKSAIAGLRGLLGTPALLVFSGCIILFQLANAAMLPLAASMMTLRSSGSATILVAISIVGPQFIVAMLSPWVGRAAQQRGRQPLLVICFVALAVRGALFSYLLDPYLLVAAQLLDGISAAMLGVLIPLIISDISRNTGHFSLAQGTVGCAVGIGASISTIVAGYVTDRFDSSAAFLMMAGIGAIGLALAWFIMPETRPDDDD
jgi:MFS family permease